MADWNECLKIGAKKEQIFKEDFLEYFNIGYVDVSGKHMEYDLKVNELKSVDVKSYRDRDTIPIEEMSIVETGKKGWFYTSPAKYFAYVSIKTRVMLLLNNSEELHKWYEDNKERFVLHTQNTDGKWSSQHRNIPLKELIISWYKKNKPIKKVEKVIGYTKCENKDCDSQIPILKDGFPDYPCKKCGWDLN